MKNIYRRILSFNTIILLFLTTLSLTIITSSNSNVISAEKEAIINTVDKTANVPENIETTKEEIKVVEKKEETKPVVTETKKTTTAKKATTKKTTTAKKTTTVKQTTTPKTTTVKTLEQKLQEKSNKYHLTIGNISISGSNFSKDLVKDDGSYYYLDHTLDKKLNYRGVPFIDFRHDFTGRKTIIYSHSAKDGTGPFNYLQNYNGNKEFFKKHQYITIHYAGKVYKYQIFSAYISTAKNDNDEGLEYFRVNNYSDAEWGKRIQEYKNKSDYDTGVSVSKNDKILILQTCSMDNRYYKKYYRYNQLVMAKLISVQ